MEQSRKVQAYTVKKCPNSIQATFQVKLQVLAIWWSLRKDIESRKAPKNIHEWKRSPTVLENFVTSVFDIWAFERNCGWWNTMAFEQLLLTKMSLLP